MILISGYLIIEAIVTVHENFKLEALSLQFVSPFGGGMEIIMKKILSYIMLVVVLMLSFQNKNANAMNLNEVELKLYAEEVPNDIVAYAHNDFQNHLNDQMDGVSVYYLGNAIKFYNYSNNLLTISKSYGFFVYDDLGNIYGTYEVLYNEQEGEFYSSFNRGLLENLQIVLQDEDKTNPYIIVSDDEFNVWAVNNKEIIEVETHDIDKQKLINKEQLLKTISNEVKLNKKLEIVSATIYDEDMKYKAFSNVPYNALSSTQKVLPVSGFAQYSLSWCAYCTTASIINYVKKAMLNPSQICYAIHGDYRDAGATMGQIKQYARAAWSFNSLNETYSLLSMSMIKYEINNNRPLYHSWRNTSTGQGHATVLNGYTDSSQYGRRYYFINSWTSTPSFSVSVNTSGSYTWINAGISRVFRGAIYNWK